MIGKDDLQMTTPTIKTNSSSKIERQKNKYGWEFLFLGANIDAVETAKSFGIDADWKKQIDKDYEKCGKGRRK